MLALWLVAATLCGAGADDVVAVLSDLSGYNQLATSSTLRWTGQGNGSVPEHAVPAAPGMWVCRARAHTNNMWLAGVLTRDDNGKGKCVASRHGVVQPYAIYEVLQNFEDGGRLTWRKWDKLHSPPGGSVTISSEPSMFVGRRKDRDGNGYHLGRIEKGLMGTIIVLEDGKEKYYDDGEVLVETEPIKYEMTILTFHPTRRARPIPMVLGSTVMRNDDEPTDDGFGGEESRVDTVIAYNHNQTVSWGQGHAILAGLPVTVSYSNGTKIDEFKWAMDSFSNHSSTYQVETLLAPGRGVNVTLVGNWSELNIAYSAKLNIIYADGMKRQRMISSTKREVGLRDVHPEYGPVYFLHNNTYVPTTTTTTTTSTTTRTTSTSSTTSSTTTEEAKPVPPSPLDLEELNSTTKKGDPADPGKKRENWPHDEPKSEPSESQASGVKGIEAGSVLFAGLVALKLFT